MRTTVLTVAAAMMASATPTAAPAAPYVDYATEVGGAFGDGEPTIGLAPAAQTYGFVPTADTRGQYADRSLFDFRLSPPAGALTVKGSSSRNAPYLGRIFLSGVPEPATWATMIAGLAGVAATLRGRRAKQARRVTI